MVGVAEALRELPQALDRLEQGEADQLVITRRNKPRAVLITVERYEQLLRLLAPEAKADLEGLSQ